MKTSSWLMGMALMALPIIGTAQDYGVQYVWAEHGLKLRAEPSLQAQVIFTLPPGAQVAPQPFESKNGWEVDGIHGNWQLVEYQGKSGYVFDGYLLWMPYPKDTMKWESYLAQHFPLIAKDSAVSHHDRLMQVGEFTTQATQSLHKNGVLVSASTYFEGFETCIEFPMVEFDKGFLVMMRFTEFRQLLRYAEKGVPRTMSEWRMANERRECGEERIVVYCGGWYVKMEQVGHGLRLCIERTMG